MAVIGDPENKQTRALFNMVDFGGKHILEIGCGDGRLTWRYADKAAHVIAIDPNAEQIMLAMDHIPIELRNRVEFRCAPFEDFAAASAASAFDIVILSWSLC